MFITIKDLELVYTLALLRVLEPASVWVDLLSVFQTFSSRMED